MKRHRDDGENITERNSFNKCHNFKKTNPFRMSCDISETKKLSTKEKLQIIDELLETIESDEAKGEETFNEDPEVIALLQERIEKYERGEGISYSWEEAKRLLYLKWTKDRMTNKISVSISSSALEDIDLITAGTTGKY